MEENKVTFWQYIQNNKIEIPIIQRDYAQGRVGKEYLRKNFLASLKSALDGTLPYDQKELKLDFVYGADEDYTVQPLDGQQRLTTLWLFHWYVALKAGKLDQAGDVLNKFSYETRRSSREFCSNLCNHSNFKEWTKINDIKGYIEGRTWFYTEWLQDPTISAMLLMLKGTNVNLEDVAEKDEQEWIEKNNLTDGIEKLFRDTDTAGFERYWEKLVSDNSPIYFYQLPLKDFGLSDDLYIKMNARGKQLTSFENFKADLIGYIRHRLKEKKEGLSPEKADHDEDWEKLMDVTSGIPINFDTTWTDIFWENRSQNNKIDDIYYAFINRMFWNSLFTAKDNGGYLLKLGRGITETGAESNTIENENISYRFLNDEKSEYADLTPYLYYDGEIPYSFFRDLSIVLNRYASLMEKYPDEKFKVPGVKWENEKPFEFIPEYIRKEKVEETEISVLTQQQRILFYAVVKYLLEGEGDKVSLGRWMRVVYNIISGTDKNNRVNLRTPALVRNAIELIGGLDSHNVYEFLYEQALIDNPSDIEKRLNSEIEKARQILEKDDEGNFRLRKYDGSIEIGGGHPETWEDVIRAAESYSFFRGYIRFLYIDSEGKIDWDNFDIRFRNVRKYFRMEIEDLEEAVNEEFNNPSLLQSLFSRVSSDLFQNEIWYLKRYTFKNNVTSWRYYLENDRMYYPVDKLLRENLSVEILQDSDDIYSNEHILYLLSQTRLLEHVVKNLGNSWIRDYHYHYAIFPSGPGVFLNAKRRDSFLMLPDIEVSDDIKVLDTGLFQGSDINFRYNGKNYQWSRDNLIYRMHDDDPNEKEFYLKENDGEEERVYIFIEVGDKTDEEIKEWLGE